ncbi:MAG TPA: hypothetical protein VKV17_12020 [Bryobacteraceae bacterium]|nr:hypothetical protein [Bryobacteraceae bacterium]
MSGHEKSSTKSLTPSEIAEAEENTARLLEALDQNGEEGLQEELDRLYPPPVDPGFHEEDLPGGFGRVLILHDNSLSNSPSPTPSEPGSSPKKT